MSNFYPHPQQPFDQEQHNPQPPTRRPKSKKPILPALLLAGGLIVGLGIGSAKPAEVKEVPGPERIVEKEVPGPRVEVVPQECLTALDHADAGFSKFATVLQAILDSDVAAADATNKELSELAPKYNAAKSACRAAG